MARVAITYLLMLFLVGCKESPELQKDSRRGLSKTEEEVAVIRHLLELYGSSEDEDAPPLFSALLGTSQSPQLLGIEPLKVDYCQEITDKLCHDLMDAGATIEVDEKTFSTQRLAEAVNSLLQMNQSSIELVGVEGVATVPVVRLNQELIDIENRTDSADEFWRSFELRHPSNWGYSSASRVGLSEDRSVAVVYFSWIGGPTLGFGGFQVLRKYDGNWLLVGDFPIWGWTS